MNIFDQDLEKNGANFVPLSPVSFVERSAEVFADAGYKVPREVRFEPIPKTSTGKIQKFALRELAAAASPSEETPK